MEPNLQNVKSDIFLISFFEETEFPCFLYGVLISQVQECFLHLFKSIMKGTYDIKAKQNLMFFSVLKSSDFPIKSNSYCIKFSYFSLS